MADLALCPNAAKRRRDGAADCAEERAQHECRNADLEHRGPCRRRIGEQADDEAHDGSYCPRADRPLRSPVLDERLLRTALRSHRDIENTSVCDRAVQRRATQMVDGVALRLPNSSGAGKMRA
jgi:hypothetical protein